MARREQVTGMKKIKEIFRLKALGLSQREIAQSCNMGRTTVQDYLHRAERAGLTFQGIETLEEERIRELLGTRQQRYTRIFNEVDFEYISRELSKRSVTLRLLWEEYRIYNPAGYSYSTFCERFAAWSGRQKLSMRQVHRAGDKAFVDYAGQKIPWVDKETGEIHEASVFVAVLGFSNKTYAEASESEKLEHWLMAHRRALEYFGGVPACAVPDNLKSGVKKACFYDPELNPAYAEFARHYGAAILPARIRRPRDKAKVEAAVQIVERWIIAALRNETFFSIHQINLRIRELLEKLNAKTMRSYGMSREELFQKYEKAELKPLPEQPYEFGHWKVARVNLDYHIEIARHYYSVPCELVHQEIDVRITEKSVEIYHKFKRIVTHCLSEEPFRYTTVREHMPKSHQFVAEWSPSRLLSWASKIGTETARQAENLMNAREHPEQGYRAVLGILRLEKKFGRERLEAACQRANHFGIKSFRAIQNMLASGHDKLPLPDKASNPHASHSNIRGGRYFH